MVRESVIRTTLAGALASLSACGLFPPTGVEITQVEVRLVLEASQVPGGGKVAAELQVVNGGTTRVTLHAEGECMAVLRVERGGVDQGFRTIPEPCWKMPAQLVLEPGDVVRQSWTIVAETVAGAPAAAGTYDVVVDMMGRLGTNSNLPGVIRSLVVSGSE